MSGYAPTLADSEPTQRERFVNPSLALALTPDPSVAASLFCRRGFCMRLGLHRDRRPNSRVATPGGFLVAIAVVSFGRGLLCHARLRYADRWGSPRNEPRPGPKLII